MLFGYSPGRSRDSRRFLVMPLLSCPCRSTALLLAVCNHDEAPSAEKLWLSYSVSSYIPILQSRTVVVFRTTSLHEVAMFLLRNSLQMLAEASFGEIRDNSVSYLSPLVLAGILLICGQPAIQMRVPLQRNCGPRIWFLHVLRYASAVP